jgi:hypothetical protein
VSAWYVSVKPHFIDVIRSDIAQTIGAHFAVRVHLFYGYLPFYAGREFLSSISIERDAHLRIAI